MGTDCALGSEDEPPGKKMQVRRSKLTGNQANDGRGTKSLTRTDASAWAAAIPMLLNRRALHRTEGAEDAAVTRLGAQHRSAVAAFVEKLAGIRGHGFLLGEAAIRAGQDGFEDDGTHLRVIGEPMPARMPAMSEPVAFNTFIGRPPAFMPSE